MHHWWPCLKLRSTILIVLSTVVAEDVNNRFSVMEVEEKSVDTGGHPWSGGFLLLETWVVFRDRWCAGIEGTEVRAEKTCYSPSVAGAGCSPRTHVVEISVVASPLPLGASSLDRYFWEDSECVSTTSRIRSVFRQHRCVAPGLFLFVCFLLSCPCVGLAKPISSTGTSMYTTWWHIPTGGTDTSVFSRSFCLTIDTHLTPRWWRTAPCCAGAHRADTCMHATWKISKQSRSWLRLPLRSTSYAIHPKSPARCPFWKPRNFILPASADFIVVASRHAACHAVDRQAYAYANGSS